MKAITLLYPDIIYPRSPAASGVVGADAAIYKLEVDVNKHSDLEGNHGATQ